jgi:hypothetical protein
MSKIKQLSENREFQRMVFVACFIFSAICLLLVISQIYYFVVPEMPPPNNARQQNDSDALQRTPPPKDDFFRGMPKESPIMFLVYLLGCIICFFAGIMIHNGLNTKEKKDIKTKVINDILLPEELIVIKLLEENNNHMTQKEIVIKSNLNKLKVSRVIKRLEFLKIIEKYPYGMTNKIKLKLDQNEKN